MKVTFTFSIKTLEWAAKKKSSSFNQVALFLFKRGLDDILKGKMTMNQARKLAKYTKTPFGFLFLKKPPKEYKQKIKYFI